jgi:hypothetical protein
MSYSIDIANRTTYSIDVTSPDGTKKTLQAYDGTNSSDSWTTISVPGDVKISTNRNTYNLLSSGIKSNIYSTRYVFCISIDLVNNTYTDKKGVHPLTDIQHEGDTLISLDDKVVASNSSTGYSNSTWVTLDYSKFISESSLGISTWILFIIIIIIIILIIVTCAAFIIYKYYKH